MSFTVTSILISCRFTSFFQCIQVRLSSVLYVPLTMTVKTLGFLFFRSWLVKVGDGCLCLYIP